MAAAFKLILHQGGIARQATSPQALPLLETGGATHRDLRQTDDRGDARKADARTGGPVVVVIESRGNFVGAAQRAV